MQEDTDSSKMDSIRSQEQIYEKQIKNTYKQHLNLFITHSSDLLHLNIVQKEHQERKYSSLSAKTGFSKFDTICEIRGSVIGFDKLKGLLESKTVQRSKLPLLLSLSVQNKYLISPKNISKFAFNNPLYRSTIGNHDKKQYQNCYIQAHYGCKLFLTASRDIPQNQQLILQQKSYDKFVFNPGQVPSEFP